MVMLFPDPLIRARMEQARSQHLQAGNVSRLAVIFPTDDGRNPVAGAEPRAFIYPVFRFGDPQSPYPIVLALTPISFSVSAIWTLRAKALAGLPVMELA